MVIICKFDIPKEYPLKDIVTYSKIYNVFMVIWGIIMYYDRHNYIPVIAWKLSMTREDKHDIRRYDYVSGWQGMDEFMISIKDMEEGSLPFLPTCSHPLRKVHFFPGIRAYLFRILAYTEDNWHTHRRGLINYWILEPSVGRQPLLN